MKVMKISDLHEVTGHACPAMVVMRARYWPSLGCRLAAEFTITAPAGWEAIAWSSAVFTLPTPTVTIVVPWAFSALADCSELDGLSDWLVANTTTAGWANARLPLAGVNNVVRTKSRPAEQKEIKCQFANLTERLIICFESSKQLSKIRYIRPPLHSMW